MFERLKALWKVVSTPSEPTLARSSENTRALVEYQKSSPENFQHFLEMKRGGGGTFFHRGKKYCVRFGDGPYHVDD